MNLAGDSGILVVQCMLIDDENSCDLVSDARHVLLEERSNAPENLHVSVMQAIHLVLVTQLPRVAGGCRNFLGFQGGKWMSAHLDELRPPGRHSPSLEHLTDRPISELFAIRSKEVLARDEIKPENPAIARKLLRDCAHGAACRIDDESGSTNRSTRRIELLLKLFPEEATSG